MNSIAKRASYNILTSATPQAIQFGFRVYKNWNNRKRDN